MPHLTLEYTTNLPMDIASRDLLGGLHGILVDVAGIDRRNCKSRAIGLGTFLSGDDPGGAYVHLDVQILEGRSEAVKAELGRQILLALCDAYQTSDRDIQITVEIRDIRRAGYFKYPDPLPA
jgi:5-carboxymethyl-2-hydroxymuconate isomerase